MPERAPELGHENGSRRRVPRERARRRAGRVAIPLVLAVLFWATGASEADDAVGDPKPRQVPEAAGDPAPSQAPEAAVAARSDRPPNAEALFARLAAMPGFSARFVETRRIGLLSAPLVSRGEIHFDPPGLLLRHTRSPTEQRIFVDRERVVLLDEERRQEIDLRGDTPIRPLVTSLLWILAGEASAIERSYRVEYAREEDGAGWSLRLVPKGAPLDLLVASIEVRGESGRPTELVVEEANGDVAVTRLEGVDTKRRFSPAERAALFGPALR